MTAEFSRLYDRLASRGLLGQCMDAMRELLVGDLSARRGRAKGGGQSSKAKGREGVRIVVDLLRATFPQLAEDDFLIKATSMGGCDVHLSPAAQALFPFGIEVKRVEALNVWAALAQATVNAVGKGLPPVLFFSRAKSPLYVALEATEFVRLLNESGRHHQKSA